ncbi:MAG: amidohydrolase [Betaproteobacteria bacterium]|nr:amidohydrolase [Betaproteobacteria bacterium]NBT75245.1 amidohydrolase [Betaproteobacteria bacterium]NBY14147.1 amidohydrolase [Betaproteobacteria bacterium]NCA16889.1 amidohydrolase [Betaproteobacteria bacterium]
MRQIDSSLIERLKPFTEVRRDIHAHPELKFEEVRTAQVVVDSLRVMGVDEIHEGIGGTGVVGVIRGRKGGGHAARAIGLRADMDALPMTERNTFAHASTVAGKMHACGHDGHTAMLLAGARLLCDSRDFAGTVHLIFQPAEEGGGGAKAMIDDGLFQRFDCEQVFAIHNWPGLAEGCFGLNPGPMMASSNQFSILVKGKGAHAAMPHLGVDPVLVATHLIQAFQSVVTRTSKPVDAVVISVTQVNAGEAINVIPDQATLRGTVRTFSIEALDRIEQAMTRICEELPKAFGASAALVFDRQYPPTVNHPEPTLAAANVARDLVGESLVVMPVEPTMGAEDFAYMLLERPGSYIFLGNGDLSGGHRAEGHGLGPCALHNPSYDFNDRLIPIGAQFWSALAHRLLA